MSTMEWVYFGFLLCATILFTAYVVIPVGERILYSTDWSTWAVNWVVVLGCAMIVAFMMLLVLFGKWSGWV